MIYDGIVAKLENMLFLFILNPNTNKMEDGINISDHECYNDLKQDQLMTVNITIKDGTQEIENLDLSEFIYGNVYDRHNTFIYIHDIMLFSISNSKTKQNNIKKIIDDGELNDVAIKCIKQSKN